MPCEDKWGQKLRAWVGMKMETQREQATSITKRKEKRPRETELWREQDGRYESPRDQGHGKGGTERPGERASVRRGQKAREREIQKGGWGKGRS